MPYSDPLRRKENHKKWHLQNREKVLVIQKQYRLRRKIKVLEKYSNGNIECSCCRESVLEFLSIDHINGGGTSHRKSLKSADIYAWLLKNDFPKGFRILCHNCNQAIGKYGICPHKRD
jgi:hypothetical protein